MFNLLSTLPSDNIISHFIDLPNACFLDKVLLLIDTPVCQRSLGSWGGWGKKQGTHSFQLLLRGYRAVSVKQLLCLTLYKVHREQSDLFCSTRVTLQNKEGNDYISHSCSVLYPLCTVPHIPAVEIILLCSKTGRPASKVFRIVQTLIMRLWTYMKNGRYKILVHYNKMCDYRKCWFSNIQHVVIMSCIALSPGQNVLGAWFSGRDM